MKNEILVSVIITTHGRLELLKNAIESVKKQTYKNIELIVIDDCSEDGTQLWAKDKDFIYEYIPKAESKGGNYARNKGISMAHGEYIAFLDDDDTWDKTKIEKQIKLFLGDSELGFVYCGYTICYSDGHSQIIIPDEEYKGDVSKKVLTYILCTTSALMVKKNYLDDVGFFDENLRFWQETELLIRLAQICKTDFVPESLMNYLQTRSKDDSSRLSTKLDDWFKSVDYINNKHHLLIDSLSNSEKKQRQLLIYGDAANRCLLSGQMKRRRFYKKEIYKLQPTLKNFLVYVLGVDKQLLRMLGF